MSPRGRRGGRGRRRPGPAGPQTPALDPPGNGHGYPEEDPQSEPEAAPDQTSPEPPPAGRGARPHNGRSDRRGGRKQGARGRPEPRVKPEGPGKHEEPEKHEGRAHEAVVDEDEDLLEEEIRAHRETTADARSGAAASPQSVAALTAFLRSMGIDPRRDPQYTVTAQLTADFLAERTAALRREPGPLRPTRYQGTPGEVVRLERIPVYGMCPHHLVPYFGSASVTYAPSDRICGIGSIARLVRELSCVPRLQESLTQAVADAIERDLEPTSIEVTIRARHLCLEMRGVEQRALFVTEAKRGGPGAPRPRQDVRRHH
ncbi:MAG TPA: GTP cyclohydrolase I [Candidatus Dormibacteraeota bacterium]|nr:GTP cyclohydrolase I [Candidatus Dormibacteraeota bacterium]